MQSSLILFLGSYVFVTITLVILLFIAPAINNETEVSKLTNSTLAPGAYRNLLLLNVLALSGIPPAFLFLGKLSLLSILFSSVSPTISVILFALVLLSWNVYYRFALILLQAPTQLPTTAQTKQRRAPLLVAIALLCVFFLFGANLFFDDAAFFAMYNSL